MYPFIVRSPYLRGHGTHIYIHKHMTNLCNGKFIAQWHNFTIQHSATGELKTLVLHSQIHKVTQVKVLNVNVDSPNSSLTLGITTEIYIFLRARNKLLYYRVRTQMSYCKMCMCTCCECD